MHRRLSALAVAALLCSAAACGRAGDLTGPDDASVPAIGGPVYVAGEDDGGLLNLDGAVENDDGGMFGNGNVSGDVPGTGESMGDLGAPSANGGMFGNGN